jgi:hypothetical protein
MREFVGMVGVAILFSGGFMLYDKFGKADAVQIVSSDERINKCVANGFPSGKPTMEIRVAVCGCIMKEMDRSFTPVEGDFLFQVFLGKPENIGSLLEERNFSRREMDALKKKADRFLRETDQRCRRELESKDEAGGV